MKPKQISRRDFLRIAGTTAAGAAFLTGCQQPIVLPAPAETAPEALTEAPPPAEDITLVGFSKEGDVADGMKVGLSLGLEQKKDIGKISLF
jgi:hypothetical protein